MEILNVEEVGCEQFSLLQAGQGLSDLGRICCICRLLSRVLMIGLNFTLNLVVDRGAKVPHGSLFSFHFLSCFSLLKLTNILFTLLYLGDRYGCHCFFFQQFGHSPLHTQVGRLAEATPFFLAVFAQRLTSLLTIENHPLYLCLPLLTALFIGNSPTH